MRRDNIASNAVRMAPTCRFLWPSGPPGSSGWTSMVGFASDTTTRPSGSDAKSIPQWSRSIRAPIGHIRRLVRRIRSHWPTTKLTIRGDSHYGRHQAMAIRQHGPNRMTTAADVPGWNSFKMIEILLAVEEHFSITMETWDLDTVHTVGDLAQRILDKVQFRTHQASGFARDTAAEETPA